MKNVRVIGLEFGQGYFYFGTFEIETPAFNASLFKIESWEGNVGFDVLFLVGILTYMKSVN